MGFDASKFTDAIEAQKRARLEAAVAGVNAFAEMVLAESQKLCPVSPTDPNHPLYIGTSGALLASGTVKDAELEGTVITARIGYHTNYAAAVHERLDLSHSYPGAINPRAQAKFLEAPMRDAEPKFVPFMIRKIGGGNA